VGLIPLKEVPRELTLLFCVRTVEGTLFEDENPQQIPNLLLP
jgi:hypothetical protein